MVRIREYPPRTICDLKNLKEILNKRAGVSDQTEFKCSNFLGRFQITFAEKIIPEFLIAG